jgi:hypothetical protein
MSNRRTGKIARLPFEVRTAVNEKLRDGVAYLAIAKWLFDEGHGKPGEINEQNLTNWKDGGHQDWLKEQERLADMQNKREFALQIVKENDGSKLHEANLHLAASQLYDVLTDFDVASLKELLADKPENYAILANSLAKLSKGNIEIQKYKDANARAMAEVEKAKSVIERGGGLTAETLERIERELKLL